MHLCIQRSLTLFRKTIEWMHICGEYKMSEVFVCTFGDSLHPTFPNNWLSSGTNQAREGFFPDHKLHGIKGGNITNISPLKASVPFLWNESIGLKKPLKSF